MDETVDKTLTKQARKPFFKSIFERPEKQKKERIEPTLGLPEHDNVTVDEMISYGDDISGLTVTSLLGTQTDRARPRAEIYRTWITMEKDPVISIALRTHAIAALGGHESKGDVVFIEENPDISEQDKKIIEELREDLSEVFNRIAFHVAYTACAFGDSYARTYYEKGRGLVRCISDEMVHPSLIQPYEQGGDTVGYVIGTNKNNLGRLTTLQLARMKMPRVSWIPQGSVVSKAYRNNILEDDHTKLPRLPSMIGGSFLYAAEKPFCDFYVSLKALVGQRLVDAIDESFITVNLSGSTKSQQKRFEEMFKGILSKSKKLADDAMDGNSYFGRTRHVIFTHNEKQLATHGEALSSKRQGSVTIDDIMLHARLLAGSLGIDLSMLGFADQLSGGLGDGGFFRMSAQIAESSRLIRVAMADFYHDIIDNHMLFKYGKKYPKGKRPYDINFYGSISAFENERQRTRADAAGAAGLMIQTFAQFKETGLSETDIVLFMTKQMLLDQEEAEIYAKSIAASKSTEEAVEGY